MKFRTEINIVRAPQTILHHEALLSIGSCFAENISTLLKERFFNVLENPFGVLYNPLSIADALQFVLKRKVFTADDLIFHQGEWHSFWHHSSFSHPDQQKCLKNINTQIQQTHYFLKQANWLIITFGTAFVYFHKQHGGVVANCHKRPENEFERRLVNIEEIVAKWERLLNALKRFNPHLRFIFTVSPIRHLRDGLTANQQSKSTLILATHRLIEKQDSAFYFPAYEILMDDLRDYRFYEANLTHPNEQAISYIWKNFQKMFFNTATQQIVQQMENFSKRLKHRFRNPDSPQAQEFKAQTEQLWQKLLKQFPYLNRENLPLF